MLKRWILLLAALPLVTLAAENATTDTKGDVLVLEEVPPGENPVQPPGTDVLDLPTRGMDMANVRNVFGAPETEHPPVGDPPITRWDYDRYSVFFEHDKVLHSVVTE